MRLILPSRSVMLFVSMGLFATHLHSQIPDSLHVRNPDSTTIITDMESVPVGIRSRSHIIGHHYLQGVFARDESALTGYWQTKNRPQYHQSAQVYGIDITQRLRTQFPMRYLPQHVLTGLGFDNKGPPRFPLRTHTLERAEEPMVNVVYKEGDYALEALSLGLATDINKQTHIHLSREYESYVGLHGLDGIRTERYNASVHHKPDENQRLIFTTIYTKDRNNWTRSDPFPGALGAESSSWYRHLLLWDHAIGKMNFGGGIVLGSHRLWMTASSGAVLKQTELLRSAVAYGQYTVMDSVVLKSRYAHNRFHLDASSKDGVLETWHKLDLDAVFSRNGVTISAGGNFVGYQGSTSNSFVLPSLSADIRTVTGVSVFANYSSEISLPGWQWNRHLIHLEFPPQKLAFTTLRRVETGIRLSPFDWLRIDGTYQNGKYSNWYRLTYTDQFARIDSTITVESLDGNFHGLSVGTSLVPVSWLTLAGRYSVYPTVSHALPEFWTRQYLHGWLHFQHFFFGNNLLFHVYVEGGAFLSREPVGWHPAFQALTYYQQRSAPDAVGFAHAVLAGKIGPFTISTSFYNLFSQGFRYAIDQRSQVEIFYLGIRWQFWN